MPINSVLLQALAKPSDPVGEAVKSIPATMQIYQNISMQKTQENAIKRKQADADQIQSIIKSSINRETGELDRDLARNRLGAAGFPEAGDALVKGEQGIRKEDEEIKNLIAKSSAADRDRLQDESQRAGSIAMSALQAGRQSPENLMASGEEALAEMVKQGLLEESDVPALSSPEEMQNFLLSTSLRAVSVLDQLKLQQEREKFSLKMKEASKMSTDEILAGIYQKMMGNERQGLPANAGLTSSEVLIFRDKIGGDRSAALEIITQSPDFLKQLFKATSGPAEAAKLTLNFVELFEQQSRQGLQIRNFKPESVEQVRRAGFDVPEGVSVDTIRSLMDRKNMTLEQAMETINRAAR